MSKERKKAYRSGMRAEVMASLFLMAKGYKVLARRYKTPVGEIDLVAAKGRRLAFVEVKSRRQKGQALWAVTPRQQQRIRRAAQYWLAQRRTQTVTFDEMGFDVIMLVPWSWPHHEINAFGH